VPTRPAIDLLPLTTAEQPGGTPIADAHRAPEGQHAGDYINYVRPTPGRLRPDGPVRCAGVNDQQSTHATMPPTVDVIA